MTQTITPKVLDDASVAFPTDVRELLPPYADIPREFKNWNSKNAYLKYIEDWFYKGVDLKRLTPRDGIDKTTALRHLSACMGSWEPKHEHKIAGCAYLLSQWFEVAA